MTDRIGWRYGRLEIIGYLGENKNGSRYHYECLCDCGNVSQVSLVNLRSGATKSCGCLEEESRPTNNRKHGMSNTAIYKVWKGMKQRCSYEKHVNYSLYGGRGIKVCDRWLGDEGFANFLEDMGDRPSNKHSIDRINNDGDYEPGNCKWATQVEQTNNMRRNRIISLEYNGSIQSKTMSEWAREVGVKPDVIEARLNRYGFAEKDAVFRPLKSYNPVV